MDLDELERRLRETDAVGLFTKLELKGQIDDLLGEMREFHHGGSGGSLADLRERYDLLLLKLLTLLQDDDPELHRDVANGQEAIWALLEDPGSFEKL